MTKPLYKILLEELETLPLSTSEEERRQVLAQIEVFLCESNLFGEDEESEEADERHPVAILEEQLFGIKEKSEWFAFLALYLATEIKQRNKENNLPLVNYALHAVNRSKAYADQAEARAKELQKGIQQYKSNLGTTANLKGKEPLNKVKAAAFERYEPAIEKLQALKERGKTNENRITYRNVAKIVYPEIAHLNEPNGRPIHIGRNGQPVEALARLFKEAASKGQLKPTRGR